jgi:hypothetical protein
LSAVQNAAIGISSGCLARGSLRSARAAGLAGTAADPGSRMISMTGPLSSEIGTPGGGVSGRGGPAETSVVARIGAGTPVAGVAVRAGTPAGGVAVRTGTPVAPAVAAPLATHTAEQYATTLPSRTPTKRERSGSTVFWQAGQVVVMGAPVPRLRRAR